MRSLFPSANRLLTRRRCFVAQIRGPFPYIGRVLAPSDPLLTGSHGYIGSVTERVLADAGHEVTGLDSYLLFEATAPIVVPWVDTIAAPPPVDLCVAVEVRDEDATEPSTTTT